MQKNQLFPAVGRGPGMSAGPEILRHAAIYRPGCFAWNRENDAPVLFHPLFHKLPFCPKSFLPLVRQRRIIPQARRRHTQKGTYPLWSVIPFSRCMGRTVASPHGRAGTGASMPLGGVSKFEPHFSVPSRGFSPQPG